MATMALLHLHLLKVSGCDLYSAGIIEETEDIHGIEIFNSIDNNYKKYF